ncbi:hypothetical protein LTR66_005082 [Elasticomyces elasticus]|nr:hypothetical protein LTR66_005082 [Elasticomyces elasticus]
MAIHRGIQSVVFYYLSCAPCTGHAYRKQRRKEAEADRANKLALEMELPGLYRHPSPFATNPHWEPDITLGPRPAQNKGKRRKQQQASSSARNTNIVPTQTSLPSDRPSSNDLSHVEGRLGSADDDDSKWNLKRYQRADEELWGTGDTGSTFGSASSLRGPSRPRTAATSTSYHSARNPDINDMHPAIVTKIANKEDALWMLQPPPAAKVMSGKERVSRTRSDSGGSSRRGDENLGRQVSKRLLAEKANRGETLDQQRSRPSSSASNGQRHDRDSPNNPPKPSPKPSRPRLSTVLSDERADEEKPILVADPSLKVLQELVSPSSILNARAKGPPIEARIKLPERRRELRTRWSMEF